MSSMSFILIGCLLFILFNDGETLICPSEYNLITMGCYKVVNGFNLTWSAAREYCDNQLSNLTGNGTVPYARTHLVALEYVTEKTSLFYWLKAYQMKNDFWTDGNVSASLWNWSSQSIVWFFNETESLYIGNGSNYKLLNNQGNYEIADVLGSEELNYICEYQIPCNGNTTCQNNATCYLNIGQELCLCAPGFTGDTCDINIDDCLSSPCLHDGNCIDDIDNYTCDCSATFYYGRNCEILKDDPTQSERSAAFWSVLGIVTGLVVILTLSDLPWEDILSAIGCSCNCFKCCSKQNDAEHINENDLRLQDSPTNDQNYEIKNLSISDGSSAPTRVSYHVMNSVWDPEYIDNQISTKSQYYGYRSPDFIKTPNNANIQSFAAAVVAKQKQKQIEDNRVYAVNINEPTSKPKDHVDTMINWTQQLQQQLRNKTARETSAGSTKQLIHSSNSNSNNY